MIYRVILIVFFLLLFSVFVNAEITEIMYNPEGNDNNKEYVEIIFDEGTSLDGWTIKDHTHQDLLLLVEGDGNSKINLIVEEGYSFDLDTSVVSVYSVGAAIGNGLSNSGDEVMLYNLDEELIVSASYTSDLANGDGNALCFDSGSYYSCLPSPGEENEVEDNNGGDDDVPEDDNIDGGNESSDFNTPVNESEKINKSEDGYIIIENIENLNKGCNNLNVKLNLWNNRNKKEEIRAYIVGVDVISTFKINPHEGQSVEIPVASCNGSLYLDEGEHVLIVEGFGEKDMKLVWLENEEHFENTSVVSKNKPIENNINEDSKVDIEPEETFEGRRRLPLGNLTLYLMYLVGGLGAYYMLFRS